MKRLSTIADMSPAHTGDESSAKVKTVPDANWRLRSISLVNVSNRFLKWYIWITWWSCWCCSSCPFPVIFNVHFFFRKMFWCSELLSYLECAWKFVICLFLLTPHKHTPFHHSLCTREFNRRESVRWLILGGTCPVRVHFFRNCLTHAEGPAVIVANRVKLLPIDKFPDGTIKEIISYCTISGCTASQCMVSYCIVLLRNVSYHIISYCTV